jgi:hypothetical protein
MSAIRNIGRLAAQMAFLSENRLCYSPGFQGGGAAVKFFVFSFGIICWLSSLTSPAASQEPSTQAGRLHFSFPFPGGFHGRYELASSNAQWVASDGRPVCAGCMGDSILQLRGDVEVVTVVCGPTGDECHKSPVVLRADAIDYNETTGKLQARGVVHTVLTQPQHDAKYKASK